MTRRYTSSRQLEVCEQAASRILPLQTGDQRLATTAQSLLGEVAAGRRWAWHQQRQAAAYVVTVLVLALAGAVAGGPAGSVPVLVTAAVVSSLLLRRSCCGSAPKTGACGPTASGR
jgi:hypothetical protein